MKKTMTLILILSFLLGLCACNSAPPSASDPAPAVETVKTGTVLEASMHTLSITAADGTTYSFITDDSTTVIGSALSAGDTVSVAFDGAYKENVLAKTVTVDQKAAPEPTAAQTPEASALEDSGPTTITGVVIEASLHTLMVAAGDGTTYSFLTDDATEVVGDSENLGDTVSVTFAGTYTENILAQKVVIDQKAENPVAKTAQEVTEPKTDGGNSGEADPDSELRYITAQVKDAAMNHVTVEWHGQTYTVLKTDQTTVEGEITVGATVRVYHLGDIADEITAVDISVIDPEPEAPEVKYITGTVVDTSMNSIVISHNGQEYSVLKDENTKSDSVFVGDTVRVYHKGSYADGMTATSIVKQ